MDIEQQMIEKYQVGQYHPRPQERRLSFQQEERFFVLVRGKNYKEAYELAEQLIQSGKCSKTVRTFAQYIKNNLLGQQCEQSISETSSEDASSDQSETASEIESSDEKNSQQSQKNCRKLNKRTYINQAFKENKFTESQHSNEKVMSEKKPSQHSVLPRINRGQSKKVEKDPFYWCGNMHKWNHNCKNENCPNRKKKINLIR